MSVVQEFGVYRPADLLRAGWPIKLVRWSVGGMRQTHDISVSVYVTATVAGRSVDLCLFDRLENRILDRSFDVEGLHYTWRDGERQHLRAESGDLADTAMHPDLVAAVREAWGNARLWAAGWVRDWHELPEVHLTGSRIHHADEVDRFPAAMLRRRVIRVDLNPVEHVQIARYLVRPGDAAEAFLAAHRASPDVQLECIDQWSPWSVITAWRFDDRSFLRALGDQRLQHLLPSLGPPSSTPLSIGLSTPNAHRTGHVVVGVWSTDLNVTYPACEIARSATTLGEKDGRSTDRG